MTIAREFFDYQAPTEAAVVGVRSSCARNLDVLLSGLVAKWPGLTTQGCYGRRPIRGGGPPSTHSFGAAIDVGYEADVDESTIAAQVVPFLVAWSLELGIDAVHDYRRCRIWRAGRTADLGDACTLWWKAQRPSSVTGMGQSWANHLHVESHPSRLDDGTSWAQRGIDT